jgi:hypothetical protein
MSVFTAILITFTHDFMDQIYFESLVKSLSTLLSTNEKLINSFGQGTGAEACV